MNDGKQTVKRTTDRPKEEEGKTWTNTWKRLRAKWYVVQWNDGYLKIACNIMQIHQKHCMLVSVCVCAATAAESYLNI